MKFKISLNGVTVEKEIPNAWHLVTFDQFLKIANAGSDVSKIISIFTGIEPDLLQKAQIKNFDVLLACLAFLQTEMNLTMPSEINGMKVPKDIENEAIARYADVQEIAKNFDVENKIANLQHYPIIAATYLTPSPYNYKNAEQLVPMLLNAPCQEVVAIANFTLQKLLRSKNATLSNYPQVVTRLSKWKQDISLWLNRLAFTIRYNI